MNTSTRSTTRGAAVATPTRQTRSTAGKRTPSSLSQTQQRYGSQVSTSELQPTSSTKHGKSSATRSGAVGLVGKRNANALDGGRRNTTGQGYLAPSSEYEELDKEANLKRRKVKEENFASEVAAKNGALKKPSTPGGEVTSSSSSGDKAAKQEAQETQKPAIKAVGVEDRPNMKQHVSSRSQGVGIDFSHFTRQMLHETGELPAKIQVPLFSKRPLLHIGALQTHVQSLPHIQRNKLSEKMGRRDIQFYDLYKLKEPAEAVHQLKENGFLVDQILEEKEPIYADIAVEDFNELFRNEDQIEQQYGQSLTVKLSVNPRSSDLTRQVCEDLTLVKPKDKEDSTKELANAFSQNPIAQAGGAFQMNEADTDLQILSHQLLNFEQEFGKTKTEISNIYAETSGNVGKMRAYLEGKTNVVTWNMLEDLALAKPDDSPEFIVLLQEKGIKEISMRRNFLKASPQFVQETIGQ